MYLVPIVVNKTHDIGSCLKNPKELLNMIRCLIRLLSPSLRPRRRDRRRCVQRAPYQGIDIIINFTVTGKMQVWEELGSASDWRREKWGEKKRAEHRPGYRTLCASDKVNMLWRSNGLFTWWTPLYVSTQDGFDLAHGSSHICSFRNVIRQRCLPLLPGSVE